MKRNFNFQHLLHTKMPHFHIFGPFWHKLTSFTHSDAIKARIIQGIAKTIAFGIFSDQYCILFSHLFTITNRILFITARNLNVIGRIIRHD